MAIRNIRRQATNPLGAPGTPTSAPIYVDSDDNILKIIPAGSGTSEVQVVDASSTQTLTNKTLTSPTLTSPTITSPAITGPAPTDVTGTTLTVTAASHAGKIVTISSASGCTITLPAATGTGNKYRFVINTSLTSGSLVVAVASGTDFMVGGAFLGSDDAANVAKYFPTANTGTLATESDTITLNRSTTGTAAKGQWIEVDDIASAIFHVRVYTNATGTEATPFSAAV